MVNKQISWNVSAPMIEKEDQIEKWLNSGKPFFIATVVDEDTGKLWQIFEIREYFFAFPFGRVPASREE